MEAVKLEMVKIGCGGGGCVELEVDGELPAMAKHSGLEFVDDETSQEMLLSFTDMLHQAPMRDRTTSRSSAALDLSKLHTIMDTSLGEAHHHA